MTILNSTQNYTLYFQRSLLPNGLETLETGHEKEGQKLPNGSALFELDIYRRRRVILFFIFIYYTYFILIGMTYLKIKNMSRQLM